jgi:hypothetical protein
MKLIPSVLYLIPTENLDEDEELDSILVYGWEKPPQPGTTLLVVPSDRDQLTRNLRWLYTVKSTSETGDREWPFELELEARPVSQPRTWYEIVREGQFRGLAPLSGDLDEDWSGSKLVHPATISMIFEMLGEA